MFAIVAHKRAMTHRTVPAESCTEVIFEIRYMGCFNGMNFPGAFNKQTHGDKNSKDDLSVFLLPNTNRMVEIPGQNAGYDHTAPVNGEPGQFEHHRRAFALSEGSPMRAAYTAMVALYEPGPWECIGFGYLNYTIGNIAEGQGGRTVIHAPYTSATNPINDAFVGNALKHEGFLRSYYDGVNGGNQLTRRVLTPNEALLSDMFQPYGCERATVFFGERLVKWSRVAMACYYNRAYNGCLYQFVGSERPSGQAVAYLQMWRNTAEYNTQGWPGAKQFVPGLVKRFTERMTPAESRVAILDQLTHHGDDSAIITFASNQYMAYVTRYGYFETAHLFRNTTPMTEEGRYNKGGQSEFIRSAITQRLQELASQPNPTYRGYGYDEISEFVNHNRRCTDMQNNLLPAVLEQQRRNYSAGTPAATIARGVLEAQLARFTTFYEFDPVAKVQSFLQAVRIFPDLRAPTTPATAVDGAGVGFREWVATAANPQTVH